jgi:hypothetical protein
VLRASLCFAADLCFTLAPILSPMPAEMIQHYMTPSDRRRTELGCLDPGVQLTRAEQRQWKSLTRQLR